VNFVGGLFASPITMRARKGPGRDNQDMSEQERTRRWAQTWKEYGPELERIRLREVRDEDNLLSLQLLARAFNQATRQQMPEESSGLVEMQFYLAKLSR